MGAQKPNKRYTHILAEYLSNLKYDDIPSDVVERAKIVTLHTIAVCMAAHKAETIKSCVEISKIMGNSHKSATIIGSGEKVSVASAAFANGTMADFLDYEDCSWTGHPTAGAVPVSLAMAEAYKKTGKEYLTALVGCYDVYQRVAMAVQPTPQRFDAGWGLYCWQIFAPTAAAAKLLNLDAEKMNQALGTAAIMTPVATEQVHATFSDFLHYTYGLTAKLGVECAHIVQGGISTLKDALEEHGGYWPGVSDQCDWDWMDRDIGKHHSIMDLLLKNWPANMWIQAPLDLLDKIVTKHSIEADDIEKIQMSPFIPNRSEQQESYTSLVRAQFSIPFCFGMYLRGPQIGWEWSLQENLTNPAVLEMCTRFEGVGQHERVSEHFKKFQQGSYPSYAMKITLKNGTVHEDSLQFPKGHPKNMYSQSQAIAQFKQATASSLSAEKANAIIDFVLNKMENCQDMSEISALLKC